MEWINNFISKLNERNIKTQKHTLHRRIQSEKIENRTPIKCVTCVNKMTHGRALSKYVKELTECNMPYLSLRDK